MTDVPHAGYLKVIQEQTRLECEDRLKRVLAWPDLARKLLDYPLRYERPDQWNGRIPGPMAADKPNDSPRRVALVKLWTEVIDAESKGTPPGCEPEAPTEGRGEPTPAMRPDQRSEDSVPAYHAPPTQKPYVPAGLRYRDIDDVSLPEEPPPRHEEPEEDW